MKRVWLILVALLGLAISVAPASAAAVYTLTKGGSAFPTPGNYGTVTLVQMGGGNNKYVQVTVQLSNGAHFQGPTGGAGYAITWNLKNNPSLQNGVNAGVAIETANTPHWGNFLVDPYTSGKHYTAAPFTSSYTDFMYAIDYTKSGSTGSDTKLVFDVYNKGVGVLISDFIPNSGGYMFAVDIWDDINNCGVTTGNVAATRVPEPGTSLLLLAGLIGVPLLYRRRKLAKA